MGESINTLLSGSNGLFARYDNPINDDKISIDVDDALVNDIIENSCLTPIPIDYDKINSMILPEWSILDLYKFPGNKEKIDSLIKVCNGFIDFGGANAYILLETNMLGFLSSFKILIQLPYIGGLGLILVSPDTPEIYKINKEEILDIITKIFKI